jgi:hypothetical protein
LPSVAADGRMTEDRRQGRRQARDRRGQARAARALVLAAIFVQGLGSHGVSADLDVTLTANDSRIGVIRTCNLGEAIRDVLGQDEEAGLHPGLDELTHVKALYVARRAH